jgi:hypothetical protein
LVYESLVLIQGVHGAQVCLDLHDLDVGKLVFKLLALEVHLFGVARNHANIETEFAQLAANLKANAI